MIRVVASLGILVVAFVGSACGDDAVRVDRFGLPLDRPVTQQDLRRLPDAALLYPGSTVTRSIGSDEHKQSDENEPDPAFVGTVATAPTGVDALLAWYDRQLTARGYVRATYYRLAGQTTGRAWTAPGNREQVQVGVYPPAGSVGYEVLFVNYRVTGPPPG